MSGRGRGKRAKAVISESDDRKENMVVDNIPKKTGRKKQFPVVAVITPDGIEGSLMPEIRRPLIVHLPIHSKDIIFSDQPILYDPCPPCNPEPYDSNADNPFSEEGEHIAQVNIVVPQVDQYSNTSIHQQNVVMQNTPVQNNTQNHDFYNMKSTLLVSFKDCNDVRTIPENSSAACFWCCHTFNWRPVVLPIRDQGEYLQVYGNFCCPECATSYLFDMRQDAHTRWEQLSLLNRVYSEACAGKIYPAPSRNTLRLFGGTLSIEEYRSLIRSQKVRIDVHHPPMVSILATMDTKPVDFYDTSLTKNVSETVKERLHKAEEVLRLKRSKPLKAWESTLDACINLKIMQDSKPSNIQEHHVL